MVYGVWSWPVMSYIRIVQYTIVHYNTLQYIKLRYSIEAPNKYLYCTVLFRTVLYKKEKICPQPDKNQAFQKLKSTLRGSWPILWLLMLAMSHPRKLVSVLYKKRKFADRQRINK